jgi:GT2 family glycosyltransferase
MYKIAFICVDYNGWKYTSSLCKSLEQQFKHGIDFSITCIVVDNSMDNENSNILSDLLTEYKWAIYKKSPRNAGYFGGINIGLAELDLTEWDFVVVCNNDLDFDSEFCINLIKVKYADNIYAICPDVLTVDGIHQNPHVLKPVSMLYKFKLDLYYSHYIIARVLTAMLQIVRPVKASPIQPHRGCEIHMGIGACYILTKEFLRKFSTLHFPHFLYGEEAFFAEQIHTSNGILWFDPTLLVHHAESASLSKIPKKITYEYARSGYSSYRNLL